MFNEAHTHVIENGSPNMCAEAMSHTRILTHTLRVYMHTYIHTHMYTHIQNTRTRVICMAMHLSTIIYMYIHVYTLIYATVILETLIYIYV